VKLGKRLAGPAMIVVYLEDMLTPRVPLAAQ